MRTHKTPPRRVILPRHEFGRNFVAYRAAPKTAAIFAGTRCANCVTTTTDSPLLIGDRRVADDTDLEGLAENALPPTGGCMRVRWYIPRTGEPDLERRALDTPAGAL